MFKAQRSYGIPCSAVADCTRGAEKQDVVSLTALEAGPLVPALLYLNLHLHLHLQAVKNVIEVYRTAPN